MGHSHIPKFGINEARIGYVNNGFMCLAKPNMLPSDGESRNYITFTEVNIDTTQCQLYSISNKIIEEV
jgi:hypothetical protein